MKQRFFLLIILFIAPLTLIFAEDSTDKVFCEVKMEMENGDIPQFSFDYNFPYVRYRAEGVYGSSTPFRLKITKPDNLYLYVLRSDSDFNAGEVPEPEQTLLTPIDKGKKEYLTFIFSQFPIDISESIEDMAYISGDYYERLQKTLKHGGLKVSPKDSENVRMVMNRAAFSARGDSGILPLTIELFHQ